MPQSLRFHFFSLRRMVHCYPPSHFFKNIMLFMCKVLNAMNVKDLNGVVQELVVHYFTLFT